MAPLTDLLSGANSKNKNKKFVWDLTHQKAFDDMKKLISRDVILTYPDFSKEFKIYADASDRQLGAVITQDNKPLAFFSRKLNSAQRNYTTTERELLSIVETLKEFRNILLGQRVTVYTDHKNLVHNTTMMTSERVMRWRLLLEEFGPNILYVKGKHNTVADALSRLNFNGQCPTQESTLYTDSELEELYASSDTDDLTFPMDTKLISEAQRQDSKLLKKVQLSNNFSTRIVEGHSLITENDRIYIPTV